MQVKDHITSESLGCLKVYKDVYEAALNDTKKTIKDMESKNYYKVNMNISSIFTNIDICNTCYREMAGQDYKVKKFSD